MIFRNQTGYFVDFVLGFLFLMLYCLWGLCLCYMLRNWGKNETFFKISFSFNDFPQSNGLFYWFRIGFFVFWCYIVCGVNAYVVICGICMSFGLNLPSVLFLKFKFLLENAWNSLLFVSYSYWFLFSYFSIDLFNLKCWLWLFQVAFLLLMCFVSVSQGSFFVWVFVSTGCG